MHYAATVIVPYEEGDTQADLIAKAEELLEPYSEHLESDPYPVECDCINMAATIAGCEAANERIGSIDQLRAQYWELPASERPEWSAYIAEWDAVKNQVISAHPDYMKPDPNCEECSGSGTRMSTYNPNGLWDWYQFGGRWTGSVAPDYDPEKDKDNIETCWLCHGTGDRKDFTYYEHKRDDGSIYYSTDIPTEATEDGGMIVYTEAPPVAWCNGCDGTGRHVKWPTQWRAFEGDVAPISVFREQRFIPFYIFTPDGAVHEHEHWDGKSFSKTDNWEQVACELYEGYVRSGDDRYFGLVFDLHC